MTDHPRIPLAGVIGSPIAHSRSPALHGFWLKRYGIKGHYVPLDIAQADLAEALRMLPKMGFVGANVTIPHKETVLRLADVVTDRAALIGAANTLIFRKDGKIHADNTDGAGFIANLRQHAPNWNPQAGPAAVFGAGGAARAVVAALIEVGVLELNCNPDNHFAEVEQAAFSPANVVPGIGFSPDKMLQARLFSYGDAQRYRLGVNFNLIPVNAPRCPYHSYHRDGQMRTDGNQGSTIAHYPNSQGEWEDQQGLREPPLPLEGSATNWDHRVDDDHFQQPGDLFRLMSPAQRQVLFENTARAMGDASAEIKRRHIGNCSKADPAYGAGVARALGLGD
mgnify:CR=1 FL=1